MTQVSLKDMLEAGVHFGHQVGRWNPKMEPFIYGAREGVHIINLGKTMRLFRDAQNFVSKITQDNGQVLFIGTKRQSQDVVQEEADRCQMPYVNHRWLGGMLTNYKTISQSLERLTTIEKSLSEENVARLSKKEILSFEKSRNKLLKSLGGIREMNGLPKAVFIVDPGHERIAVKEAQRLHIPIIALCDTNANPDEIDYPIPANDDAIRSIKLFAAALANTVIETSAIKESGDFNAAYSGGEAFSSETGISQTSDRSVEVVHKGKGDNDNSGSADSSTDPEKGTSAQGEPTTDATANPDNNAGATAS